MIECAVGIVFNEGGDILISQRPRQKIGGDLWEFPGGKLEPGEAPETALVREFKEEVGIEILAFEKFLTLNHQFSGHHITLQVFLVRKYLGNPQGLEGQTIAWVNTQQLHIYPFLPANKVIIEKLMDLGCPC